MIRIILILRLHEHLLKGILVVAKLCKTAVPCGKCCFLSTLPNVGTVNKWVTFAHALGQTVQIATVDAFIVCLVRVKREERHCCCCVQRGREEHKNGEQTLRMDSASNQTLENEKNEKIFKACLADAYSAMTDRGR